MKSAWALAAGLACALCVGTVHAELVKNSDFGGGTVSFSSAYSLSLSGSMEGQFGVVADPSAWNPSFSSFTDNSGSGLMLVADGSTNALLDPVIWAQATHVENGKTYDFSFWATNASPSSTHPDTGLLTMTVSNGGVLGSATLDLSGGAIGTFSQAASTFTATSTGDVFVRIRNSNFGATGNDFAIDDISVTEVPEPSTLALFGVCSLVGLGIYRRRRRG